MTKILIKLFITCSQCGFVPYKEDGNRIHFHGTFGKAVAQIAFDIIEDKNILLFFYDLKNPKYLIIDSAKAFDCQIVHAAFYEAIAMAKASLPKEEASLPKEEKNTLLEALRK